MYVYEYVSFRKLLTTVPYDCLHQDVVDSHIVNLSQLFAITTTIIIFPLQMSSNPVFPLRQRGARRTTPSIRPNVSSRFTSTTTPTSSSSPSTTTTQSATASSPTSDSEPARWTLSKWFGSLIVVGVMMFGVIFMVSRHALYNINPIPASAREQAAQVDKAHFSQLFSHVEESEPRFMEYFINGYGHHPDTQSTEQKGTPLHRVVVIHGLFATGRMCARQNFLLAKERIQVICITLPGFGCSDPHTYSNITDIAQDIVDITIAADWPTDEPFSIAGYSHGAMFAAAVASVIPTHINHVGLYGFPTPSRMLGFNRHPDDSSMMRTLRQLSESLSAQRTFVELSGAMSRTAVSNLGRSMLTSLPPQHFVHIRDILEPVHHDMKMSFAHSHLGFVDVMYAFKSKNAFQLWNLANIIGRVHIVAFELDPFSPIEWVKHLHSNIPNSELTIFDHETHYGIYSHDELLQYLVGDDQ
jgi:pimeloyl-ACP methyl ester carboxylesterase